MSWFATTEDIDSGLVGDLIIKPVEYLFVARERCPNRLSG